jgi:hypothetical protein
LSFCLTHLIAGPYQDIVKVFLILGTMFRILPFIIGVAFLLFQKRSALLEFSRSIALRIIRCPQSAAASWQRFRAKQANPEEDSLMRRGTGDGNLHIASASRRPRLSELSDSLIIPRVGIDLDSDEFSMTEMKAHA